MARQVHQQVASLRCRDRSGHGGATGPVTESLGETMTYSMPEPKPHSPDTRLLQTRGRIESRTPARVLMFPRTAPLLPGLAMPAQKLEIHQEWSGRPAARAWSPILDALHACRGVLRAASGSGVAVHVSAESGLPAVALDDESLERVLLQLVKNAAEAMPGGGAVHIMARRALSRSTPAVLVHISDDGHGIAALALEHIFKPGFSSRRSTRGWSESCGLGLTVVRDLVQSVGGSIEVASRRRRGTTFELRLPHKPTSN